MKKLKASELPKTSEMSFFLCVCVTNISTYIILIAWTGIVYESSCMITVKISGLLLLTKFYNSNIWNYIPWKRNSDRARSNLKGNLRQS